MAHKVKVLVTFFGRRKKSREKKKEEINVHYDIYVLYSYWVSDDDIIK